MCVCVKMGKTFLRQWHLRREQNDETKVAMGRPKEKSFKNEKRKYKFSGERGPSAEV